MKQSTLQQPGVDAGIVWPWIAATALVLALASPSSARIVHLVPADDTALAIVSLIGQGLKDPVLLVDARDQTALRNAAAEWKGKVECRYRQSAGRAVVEAMGALADQPCAAIADLGATVRELWPQPHAIVVAPEGDYPWLLRAAGFAGATGAALLPIAKGQRLTAATVDGWKGVETIYVTPGVEHDPAGIGAKLVPIETADTLLTELKRVAGDDLGRMIVVANPQDGVGVFSPSALSMVAPLVSAAHRAPLILTSTADSDIVEREVLATIDAHGLAPTHLVLVGDELGLRSHRVPDPVLAAGGPEARGGGTIVRVELFSEIQHERPQDYIVGRIVAEDAAQASALLARQLHRRQRKNQRPVTFLANADSVFALGETISRTTVRELSNLGVPVRAYYRGEVTPEIIKQTMVQTDVLVWEGHPRDLTLEERGGIAVDTAPGIAILQGCYTLDRSDPFILIEKGTTAIVATSAAIYSAPGSAFARALLDNALYDGVDLGTAVRNGRNYLLALAQLQRVRGHQEWRKTYRAALAFALWGDPTQTIPLKTEKPSVKPITWEAAPEELKLTIPHQRLREVTVDDYSAKPAPRTMYGGLLLRQPDPKKRELKDLYFTTQAVLDGQRNACRPGEGWDVISLYAPRLRTLSVLARPDWDKVHATPRQGTFAFQLKANSGACGEPMPAPPDVP